MNGLISITENVAYIQEAIRDASIGLGSGVWSKSRVIVMIAIIIFMYKEAFLILASGGKEKIEPLKHIVKPFFYVLVFIIWSSVLTFIVNQSNYLGRILINNNAANTYSNEMEKLFQLIEFHITAEMTSNSILNIMGAGVSKILGMYILMGLKELGLLLDKNFIMLFAAYSQIMLEILKIVSPIALALSFIPSLKNTLTTWFKSFISVNLWFGTAALIFNLINALSLAYFKHNLSSVEFGDNLDFTVGLKVGLVFVMLSIFKGVMMFKVPQIVSMFIGNSSSGGMFGAAFAPIMIGMGVAKAGASAGKTALSGFKAK
jgi:hypothetical protein